MSPSVVHAAAQRLTAARLWQPELRRIQRHALLEFLVHGARYAFPGELGPVARGVPTAWSAGLIAARLVTSPQERVVWPSRDGGVSGQSLAPLHPAVPKLAARSPALHEFLALVDAARIGRARERAWAADALRATLLGAPAIRQGAA